MRSILPLKPLRTLLLFTCLICVLIKCKYYFLFASNFYFSFYNKLSTFLYIFANHIFRLQGVSINILLRIFRKGWMIFSKKFLNYKLCKTYIHVNLKKNRILTYIAKKIQARQFSRFFFCC